MKVLFLDEKYIAEMHFNGELCRVYQPPYSDMPSDFVEQELRIFRGLSGIFNGKFESESTYVSLETWADQVIRAYIDISLFTPETVHLLFEFLKQQPAGHCLYCGVEEMFVEDGAYFGRFVFNNRMFLVEERLEKTWMEKIGDDFDFRQWDD